MTRRRAWLIAAAAWGLCACAAPEVTQYAAERPLLDLREYFSGRVNAWGTFADRSGKIVKRFKLVIDCRWQGDDGVLDEAFTYSDGSLQRRVWRLRRLPDGRYTGLADDVVGQAQGQASGNALHWNYTLALPVDGRTWHVEMDDWMYLMDARTLMNRTVMSKLGVRLGEVTIFFVKPA